MSLFLVTHGNIHLLCNVCYVYCHHQMVHPSPFFFFPFFLTSYWVSVFFCFFFTLPNKRRWWICLCLCVFCLCLSVVLFSGSSSEVSEPTVRQMRSKQSMRPEREPVRQSDRCSKHVGHLLCRPDTHTHRVTTYTVSQRLYYIYIFIYPVFQDNCDTL